MTRSFRSLPDDIASSSAVRGDGGVELVLYRLRAGRDDGAVRLVGHCNGFAAGCYRDLLGALAVAGEDVFAFDQRGQGGADAPDPADPESYAPDRFALDLAAVIEAVAALRPGAPIRYLGHSLSAIAMLRLAARFPARLAALPLASALLIEPPVFPTPDLAMHAECAEKNRVLVARTRRRRAAWPSPIAYAAALEGRGPFAAFAPGQLLRVAEATLSPADGGFRLACMPTVEAAVFENFGQPVVFPDLAGMESPFPLHLVSGDPDVGPGRDWVTAVMADVARALRPASFTTLPGRGHLVPFEAPEETLSLVRSLG